MDAAVGWLKSLFSDGDRLMLALLIIVLSACAGWAINRVMGASGFGALGNGLLILVGVATAFAMAPARFSFQYPMETLSTSATAAVAGTAVLILAGLLKSWLVGAR